MVQVERSDGSLSNPVSVSIAPRAPRLLLLSGGYGAIVNYYDGSLPMPTGTYGVFATHPAQVGDALTIYAIGLGQTSPAVASGAPAPGSPDPLARLSTTPTVLFGTGIAAASATPFFAGLTPTAAGLYQVNVIIPPGVPTGSNINVSLVFPDSTSNIASIAIQ